MYLWVSCVEGDGGPPSLHLCCHSWAQMYSGALSLLSYATEMWADTTASFTKPSWQALLCKHITALCLSVCYRNNPPENTLILLLKQLLALYPVFIGPLHCLTVYFLLLKLGYCEVCFVTLILIQCVRVCIDIHLEVNILPPHKDI